MEDSNRPDWKPRGSGQNEVSQVKCREPCEIIIISGDDEIADNEGTGSQDDPIILRQWCTGNIISTFIDEATVIDDEDEGEDVEGDDDGNSSTVGTLRTTTDVAIEEDDEGYLSDIDRTLPGDSPGGIATDSENLDEPTASISGEEAHNYTLDWEAVRTKSPEEQPAASATRQQAEEIPSQLRSEPSHVSPTHQEGVEAQLKMKKRLFYTIYGPKTIDTLRTRLSRLRPAIQQLEEDACWLYSGDLEDKKGILQTQLRFFHEGTRFVYYTNMALVALFVEGLLSEEAIEGIIEHQWHASHLCGNFWCTNHRHLVVEPGKININRNPCLRSPESPCLHTPKCMKHLKVVDRPRPRASPEESQSSNSIDMAL